MSTWSLRPRSRSSSAASRVSGVAARRRAHSARVKLMLREGATAGHSARAQRRSAAPRAARRSSIGRVTTPDDSPVSAEDERLSPVPPTQGPRRLRRLLSLTTLDLGPLRRHRDFRLLFAGQAVSFMGSMVTYVAIPFQVYQLTGSSLAVGLLGVAELAPLLVSAFVGG